MNEPDPNDPPKPKSGCSWWVIAPVGCVGMMVLCCGGFGGLFLWYSNAIKSSPAYTDAIKIATESPVVQKTLGTPITVGFMTSINASYKNSVMTYDFTIPLSGPTADGSVHVVATSTAADNKKWDFITLDFQSAGKTTSLLGTKNAETLEPK